MLNVDVARNLYSAFVIRKTARGGDSKGQEDRQVEKTRQNENYHQTNVKGEVRNRPKTFSR